jgi:hypothetical protein
MESEFSDGRHQTTTDGEPKRREINKNDVNLLHGESIHPCL